MAVQARFFVDRITKHARFDGVEVILSPVTGGRSDKDNADWSKWTPSGEIRLNVTVGGASEWFESMLGRDVAITFDARPDDE